MLLHILENIEFEGTAPPILCADLYGIVPPLKIYQIHNIVKLRNRPRIISGKWYYMYLFIIRSNVFSNELI